LLASAGFLLLVACAYGWLGGPALWALERQHAPLAAPPAEAKWIVVLGGGTSSDATLPATSRASAATLARLVEGVRLQRQRPGTKLLVSGGVVLGSGSDAESMSALAATLGVAAADLVIESGSVDTESQARIIREIVKGEPCVLVTSAAHMPRSVALFRKAGLNPVPAPTHYLSQPHDGLRYTDFFPQADRLKGVESAAHEYIAIAWARLTGSL
jgi:uncharacterized SAM-binding protein YcdF (DUF218 family)